MSPSYAREALDGGAAGWLRGTLLRPEVMSAVQALGCVAVGRGRARNHRNASAAAAHAKATNSSQSADGTPSHHIRHHATIIIIITITSSSHHHHQINNQVRPKVRGVLNGIDTGEW